MMSNEAFKIIMERIEELEKRQAEIERYQSEMRKESPSGFMNKYGYRVLMREYEMNQKTLESNQLLKRKLLSVSR